jgi:serine/threonine-protein kinase
MTAQARLLGGRYQVGELLGYGGMAEVHRGRDLRLGRDVAIKMLRSDLARDDTFQQRFRREAQNAASLNHPAIVAVYDTGEERGPNGETLPYIVMEFVNGRTLKEVLAAEHRLMPRRALDITAEICSALEFSHRHGIIHRDIKPGNVMLTQTGQVKVMDFGIARALASGASTMTQTSAVIGTAQYLSPEQARGEAVDARSDVYATGCVLYELLCGHPPFVGDSPVSVAYQHVREDARPPSESNRDVPPPVDAVVLKALAKNPLNRYQSAGEMRQDVLRAAAGRPVQAEPVLREPEIASTQVVRPPAGTRHVGARVGDARRRRTSGWAIAALTALGVLAVVALTAGLIVASQPSKRTVPALIGQTNDQARTQLQQLRLVPESSPEFNATCTINRVIRQDPTAGTKLSVGEKVRLTYCGGANKVIVPTVVNQDQATAENTLRQAHLEPVIVQESSDKPAGTVIRTDPLGGAEVAENTKVTVVVSKGDLKVVPNVANLGLSANQAKALLHQFGFDNVKVVDQPTNDPDEDGKVTQQNPEAGQARDPKAQVVIFVGQYTAPTQPPTTPPTSPPPGP